MIMMVQLRNGVQCRLVYWMIHTWYEAGFSNIGLKFQNNTPTTEQHRFHVPDTWHESSRLIWQIEVPFDENHQIWFIGTLFAFELNSGSFEPNLGSLHWSVENETRPDQPERIIIIILTRRPLNLVSSHSSSLDPIYRYFGKTNASHPICQLLIKSQPEIS